MQVSYCALQAMLNTIVPLIAFAAAAVAQSPSATTSQPESTTASLLLGTLTTGFSGTIVSAEPCRTTYALTCSGQEICPDPVTVIFVPLFHQDHSPPNAYPSSPPSKAPPSMNTTSPRASATTEAKAKLTCPKAVPCRTLRLPSAECGNPSPLKDEVRQRI